MQHPKIKYLQNQEIDREKWDRCISTSSNDRIYAKTWYLDMMNPEWAGFVYDDYQFVMPLSVNTKFGITYVYQPVYAQQWGIFPSPPDNLLHDFFNLLISKFRYVHYSFNSENQFTGSQHWLKNRINLVLPLSQPYDQISAGYSAHTQRNLKKASPKLSVVDFLQIHDYLQLKEKYPGVEGKENYLALLQLIGRQSLLKKQGQIFGAYSEKNELVAAVLFLFGNKRIVYLNAVSSPEGKETRAMYAIVDQVIRRFSGSGYLLDFDGSSVPGVARFYKGFGANQELFSHLEINNLRWPLKLFKK